MKYKICLKKALNTAIKHKDLKRQNDIENLGWSFIRFKDYIPTVEELKERIENVQNF